jgi:hypothetical protein
MIRVYTLKDQTSPIVVLKHPPKAIMSIHHLTELVITVA